MLLVTIQVAVEIAKNRGGGLEVALLVGLGVRPFVAYRSYSTSRDIAVISRRVLKARAFRWQIGS